MDLASFLESVSKGAIPIVFAITVHEVAHGWVAKFFGDRTAEMQGRLSLNPIRHIDPVGTVLVPLILLLLPGDFLFGWAKPVPVDSRNLRNPRGNMVWVSAAGPTANLVMAIIWAFLLKVSQIVDLGVAGQWIAAMALIGIFVNVLLAVFNMLPIPPLDGGQFVRNLLPPGPLSVLLDRIAPFGLFIVVGLLVTGMLWPLVGGPINSIIELLVAAFGLQVA